MLGGVVVSIQAMTVMNRSEAGLQERQRLNSLAQSKLAEIVRTEEYQSAESGTFDAPFENFSWSLETVDSGVTDLSALRLTVSSEASDKTGLAETLVYTGVPETGEATQ